MAGLAVHVAKCDVVVVGGVVCGANGLCLVMSAVAMMHRCCWRIGWPSLFAAQHHKCTASLLALSSMLNNTRETTVCFFLTLVLLGSTFRKWPAMGGCHQLTAQLLCCDQGWCGQQRSCTTASLHQATHQQSSFWGIGVVLCVCLERKGRRKLQQPSCLSLEGAWANSKSNLTSISHENRRHQGARLVNGWQMP